MNREAEEEEARLAVSEDNKVGSKSPMPARKAAVKELPKQANGAFVAAVIAPDPVPSPRTYRANRAKALESKAQQVKLWLHECETFDDIL